ncbi:MAG: SsrA-binding protein [Fimbriimonadaceae bacterium]|nr:SsrA-binding protein [Fimbriimonadaceae bacterium]
MAKAKKLDRQEGPATIQNRRARFDYIIEESFEAGIVLVGSEVKSLYRGRANLTDAYCQINNGELFVFELDIEPYDHASIFLQPRRRERKLLMHRHEIELIERKSREKGYTLIPLKAYFKNGRVKLEIGLARGKKQFDKREQIKEKDTRREKEQARNLKI